MLPKQSETANFQRAFVCGFLLSSHVVAVYLLALDNEDDPHVGNTDSVDSCCRGGGERSDISKGVHR